MKNRINQSKARTRSLTSSCLYGVGVAIAMVMPCSDRVAWGQVASEIASKRTELAIGPTEGELRELSQWIRWLALMNLPPSIEDNRHWDLKRDVYDGFDLKLDGLRIDTKRKWKSVRHGTWSRYQIDFVDPANQLDIAVQRLESKPSGRSFTATTQIITPLKLYGRMSRYQRDIQMMSISMDADAVVAMDVDVDVEIRVNPLMFPPEVEFRPTVTRAQVDVREFEVHRISHIHGDAAELLGKGIRKMLDRQLDRTNDQLVEKINVSIAKQQHKLKLSAQEWFQK